MQKLNTNGTWRTYSVADGLPGLQTEHVTEDAQGFLWVGTWAGGACRFDGDRFQTFTSADGLPNDRVFFIHLDRQDRLWFGTEAGVCWWDGRSFHGFAPGDGVSDKSITFIAEASDGRLYFAGIQAMGYYEDGRFYDLLPAYSEQFKEAPDKLSQVSCWGIAEDGDGDIWFAYIGDVQMSGVMRYDGRDFHLYGEQHGLASAAYVLAADADGGLWISGNEQIWRYTNGTFDPVAVELKAGVRKIQCDAAGRLWFCTNQSGVLCYDGDQFHHFTTQDGLPFEVVNGMHQDREGLFWFATWGGGLGCYDLRGVQVLGRADGMPASTTVVEDAQGDLWMEFSSALAAHKIARYNGERVEVFNELPGLAICSTVYRDSADRLLFAGSGLLHHDGTTFHRLGDPSDFSDIIVFTLGEDDQGNLLLGYFQGEYSRQSWLEGRLQIARYDGTSLEPLVSREAVGLTRISAITAASQGGFWFGINATNESDAKGCGLGRWHRDDGVTFYTTADGLVANDVTGLAEDRHGVLWVTTISGVSCFDGATFHNFTMADGLPTNRVYCVYLDRQDQRWFGTESGVVRYNGEFFQTVHDPQISAVHDIIQDRQDQYWFATVSGTVRYQPTATPPKVRVMQILADRPYQADEKIQFSTSTQQVICEYTGMSFRSRPEHMLYRYRLSGHQEEWCQPTRERRAFFQELPPGEYTFEVQAIDRDFNESAPATVKLSVTLDRRDQRIDALEQQVAARTQELEHKNRELVIEQALERVRTQIAALQKSEDLQAVVDTVKESLSTLGVPCRDMGINTISDDANTITYHTLTNTRQVGLDEQTDMHQQYIAYWKKSETFVLFYSPEDIRGFIQQEFEIGKLTAEESAEKQEGVKPNYPDGLWVVDAPFAHGTLAMNKPGPEPFSDQDVRLLERFTEVFALGYRRYLDLQAAEQRQQQAERERSVERVRAEALSMRHSDDMAKVVAVLWQQMLDLSIETIGASVVFIEREQDRVTIYTAHANPRTYGFTRDPSITIDAIELSDEVLVRYDVNTFEEFIKGSFIAIEEREQVITALEAGEPFSYHSSMVLEDIFFSGWHGEVPERFYQDIYGEWTVTNVPFSHGMVGYRETQYVEAHIPIVQELSEALSLGYLRYLDFQQLEQRNRDLAVEAALERVRAQTLGMQQSTEILAVTDLLYQEFQELGFPLRSAEIDLVDEAADTVEVWGIRPSTGFRMRFKIPFSVCSEMAAFRKAHAARASGAHYTHVWNKAEYEETMRRHFAAANLGDPEQMGVRFGDGITSHFFPFPHGFFTLWMTQEISASDLDIAKRFADTFAFAYTRFLELEQAEDRTRQAERERSVERVRSEAMSMRSTDDLHRVVAVLFGEMVRLGVATRGCGIVFIDQQTEHLTHYTALENPRRHGIGWTSPELVEFDAERAVYRGTIGSSNLVTDEKTYLEFWRRGEPFTYERTPEEIEQVRRMLLERFGLERMIPLEDFGINGVPFTHGIVAIVGAPLPAAQIPLVQELTTALEIGYLRYLDFQKLEDHNRQLEQRNRSLAVATALERVRSQTLGMQQSADILDVCDLLFQELQGLGFPLRSVTIDIEDKGADRFEVWAIRPSSGFRGKIIITGKTAFGNASYRNARAARVSGATHYTHVWNEVEYEETMRRITEAVNLGDAKQVGFTFGDGVISHHLFFPQGHFTLWMTQEISASELAEAIRFTSTFAFAYTRFLELEQAEARTRQAQIEAGLERVRAEVTSMQQSADIVTVLSVMWEELKALGLDFATIAIAIQDEQRDFYTSYNIWDEAIFETIKERIGSLPHNIYSIGHGLAVATNKSMLSDSKDVSPGLKYQTPQTTWNEQDVAQLMDLIEQGFGFRATADEYRVRFWSKATFEFGALSLGKEDTTPLSDGDMALLQRVADVFSSGYARYLDFQRLERDSAVERVRTQVFSMQQANDLDQVVLALGHELQGLDIQFNNCGLQIVGEGGTDAENLFLSYGSESVERSQTSGWQAHTSVYTAWDQQQIVYRADLAKDDPYGEEGMLASGLRSIVDVPFRYGTLALNSKNPNAFWPPDMEIFQAFAAAIEGAYARHLDFQQLELQRQQALRESAVERVRAEALSMQTSDDINKVAAVLYKEIKSLGVKTVESAIVFMDEAAETGYNYHAVPNPRQYAEPDRPLHPDLVEVDDEVMVHYWESSFDQIRQSNIVDGVHALDGWRSGKVWTLTREFTEDSIPNFWARLGFGNLPFDRFFEEYSTLSWPCQFVSTCVPFEYGFVRIRWTEFRQQDADIVAELTQALSLGYLRFLDLQAAEERQRQAERERASEQVRAEAMSMRHSDDINKVAAVLNKGIVGLGIATLDSSIVFMDEAAQKAYTYQALINFRQLVEPDGPFPPNLVEVDSEFMVSYFESEFDQIQYIDVAAGVDVVDSWKSGEVWTFTQRITEDMVRDTWAGWGFSKMPLDQFSNHFSSLPYEYIATCIPFKYGFVRIMTQAFRQQDADIVAELTEALSLGYLRFLDLQAAEERQRQAERERASERVRAEALDMRQSADINKVAAVLDKEIKSLGIVTLESAIVFMDEAVQKSYTYQAIDNLRQYAEPDGPLSPNMVEVDNSMVNYYESTFEQIQQSANVSGVDEVEGWKSGEVWTTTRIFTEDMIRNIWANWGFSKMSLDQFSIRVSSLPCEFVATCIPFEYGYVRIRTQTFRQQDADIVAELTQALSLGYLRFLDLQAAEQRQRQAERERSVERVRAEALAMRQSDDLLRVVAVLYDELKREDADRRWCNINFFDENSDQIIQYVAVDNFRRQTSGEVHPGTLELSENVVAYIQYQKPFSELADNKKEVWTQQQPQTRIVNIDRQFLEASRLERIEYYRQSAPGQASSALEGDLYQNSPALEEYWLGEYRVHSLPFKQGIFDLGQTRDFKNEDLALIQEFIDAISLGFLRYLGFRQLEAEVAERQRAEEAMRQAKEEAEAANRAKSQFLANMSHEIRTPMNAILGYAQLLQRDSDLSPDQQQAIATIEKSGDHLLRLINDVLDLSKIEAGRLELTPADFDLHQLLHSLSTMFTLRCDQKKLGWKLTGVGDAAKPVHGDEAKLSQILINLLGNAVKFTKSGEVALHFAPLVDDRYRFEVADTGPGIDPAEQQTLFAAFEQGIAGRDQGGTGLGLSITSSLLELMDTTLELDSAAGKGARFFFTLTLPPAQNELPQIQQADWSQVRHLKAGQTVNALVVDDVRENREVLSRLLRSVGVEAQLAESGEAALEAVQQHMPDIIFMDIRMPGIDGMETGRRLWQQWGQDATKIVAISASVLDHERRGYLDAGFNAFIDKPFRTERIYAAMAQLLAVEYDYAEVTPVQEKTPLQLEGLVLPTALAQRLKEAAELTSVTELEGLLDEVEELGEAGQPLAKHLRQLSQDFDMDGVIAVLDGIAAE
jgi:signal transduction histidine kinase/ligand-binding sensor domain-containing protein/DNA-binding response OmpR family regulator